MEIARVYFDVSMSMSFHGLQEIMRKSKVNPAVVPPGKFTVFINKAQTAFKVLVGTHHIIYHNNGTRRFPLEAIQNFPEFFDARKLDFNAAVKKTVTKKYADVMAEQRPRPSVIPASARNH